MKTEKIYNLSDLQLIVVFSDKLIQIKSPVALQAYLSITTEERTSLLVDQIKNDYLTLMGKKLEIEKDSMMIEIWGHVYASYVAKAMKNLVELKLVDHVADFITNKSDIIDCGEKEIDHNRGFWDLLTNFKGIILKFLPNK